MGKTSYTLFRRKHKRRRQLFIRRRKWKLLVRFHKWKLLVGIRGQLCLRRIFKRRIPISRRIFKRRIPVSRRIFKRRIPVSPNGLQRVFKRRIRISPSGVRRIFCKVDTNGQRRFFPQAIQQHLLLLVVVNDCE